MSITPIVHKNDKKKQTKKLVAIFLAADKLSIKNDSYFDIYESLFERYIGRQITFVEIGVFNGGSLHMWREYFGESARIIGIDLNPIAMELKKDGFEIFIGNQESHEFWLTLKDQLGSVDIILDDGGHRNGQQISTIYYGVELIKDGGIIVVEDTHTSYFRRFGNPSPFSFINYSKMIVDVIGSRFRYVKSMRSKFYDCVWGVSFFESIVAYYIDRTKCKIGSPIANSGASLNALDFRHVSSKYVSGLSSLESRIYSCRLAGPVKKLVSKAFDFLLFVYEFICGIRLYRTYWR